MLLPIAYFLTLAAAPPATVAGTVRDAETGRALQGATVVMAELARMTSSGADGRYVMPGVPAGPQHLTIRLFGYEPHAVHVIVPREGTLELDVALRPLAVRLPVVAVRHRATERGDSLVTASEGVSVTAYELARSPFSGDRDLFAVMSRGVVVARAETPGGCTCEAARPTRPGTR